VRRSGEKPGTSAFAQYSSENQYTIRQRQLQGSTPDGSVKLFSEARTRQEMHLPENVHPPNGWCA
jgi:hypothetical protein